MARDRESFFRESSVVAEEYIRERILLLKLQTAEKTARLVSVIFAAFIIGVFISLLLLVVTALGVYFLAEITGSWYYGMGIISVVYIVIVLLLVYFRHAIFYRLIADLVIRIFFEKNESDDAEKI